VSSKPKIDPRAIVDTKKIGARTRVYEFTHVLKGAVIGADCNLNSHCFVEGGAVVGDRVTLKCGVYLWDGVTLEDDVFVGPNATFTNDRRPRSRRPVPHPETIVRKGASIGAGAVIGPGIEVGAHALVGMGAVVTKSVASHALVYGNPAKRQGWVCFCGAPAKAPPKKCPH